jgi:hypothetical protein
MADGLFGGLYKKVVPVNARLALEQFTGTTAPITEKDFTPEELAALRKAIQTTQKQNDKIEATYRNNLQRTKTDYDKQPESRLIPDPSNSSSGKLVSATVPYEEWLNAQKKAVASYENTRDKTSFSYGSYGVKSGEDAAPVGQGWLSAIAQSYNDPAFRMAATIGSANYYDKKGESPYVQDTYGFSNNPTFYGDTSKMSNMDIIQKFGDRPGTMFELLASRLAPQRRPVNISLPSTQMPTNPAYRDPFTDTTKD